MPWELVDSREKSDLSSVMVSTTLNSCSQEAKATPACRGKTNLITSQSPFLENDGIAEHEVSSCTTASAPCRLLFAGLQFTWEDWYYV
jgi:hypothetical protein